MITGFSASTSPRLLKSFGAVCGAAIVALAVVALAPTASFAASKIGIVAMVRNQVTAMFGADTRTLSLGNDVFAGDRVLTGNLGTAQLMLLDQSNVTIGQGSDLTLDRFVNDPARGRNEIWFSVTKGELRFISRAENSPTYHVETPLATIDIRGALAYHIFFGTTQYIVNIRGQVSAALRYPGGDVTSPSYFDLVPLSSAVPPDPVAPPNAMSPSGSVIIDIPQGSELVLVAPDDPLLPDSEITYWLTKWDVGMANFYGLAEVPLFPEFDAQPN